MAFLSRPRWLSAAFNRHTVAIASVFALLAGLSAWLQFGVLERAPATAEAAADAPDYTIANFTAAGIDEFGKAYRLSAARLTHYPAGHALVERPRIVQYPNGGGGARRIEADTGRLGDDGVMRLAGNVRVREGESVASVQTMTVRLGRL